MAYVNHVVGKTRVFDFAYDPTYTVAGENSEIKSKRISMILNSEIPKQNFLFDSQFVNQKKNNDVKVPETPAERLCGGMSWKIGYSQKKNKNSRCRYELHPKPIPNIITIPFNYEDQKLPKKFKIQSNRKSKGTQSIYRESAAQTVYYEPDITKCHDEVKDLEIYQIRNLINGINYPDNLEIEAIARTRQRRIYEKFLVENHDTINIKEQTSIIETFEFEEWIAREQQIFECQKLRMLIVSRIFREREICFLKKSDQVIADNIKIMNKENNRLKTKNEIVYRRKLRRLKKDHDNVLRYKKLNPSTEHAERSSDLYGPQMRFGKNPKGRNYIGKIQKFEERLDKLEEKVQIGAPATLISPQAWLNFMAKPKERTKEINKELGHDSYLKTLYNDIRDLNIFKTKHMQKIKPLCLKLREIMDANEIEKKSFNNQEQIVCDLYRNEVNKLNLSTEEDACKNADYIREECIEIDSIILEKNLTYHKLCENAYRKESMMTQALKEFQDTRIGFLLNFLNKELQRLKELKQIEALCLLAQQERVKREAMEAGRRQKENVRRFEQECTYEDNYNMQNDAITCYLENILLEEYEINGDVRARENMQNLIKIMTNDYITLSNNRIVVNNILSKYLYPNMYSKLNKLEEAHYAKSIENEIDRAINGLFNKKTKVEEDADHTDLIFSNVLKRVIPSPVEVSETTSDSDSAAYEAKMVIKKILNNIIRKPTVKTSKEHIIHETINDIIEKDVFKKLNEVEGEPNPCNKRKSLLKILLDIEKQIKQLDAEENVTLVHGVESHHQLEPVDPLSSDEVVDVKRESSEDTSDTSSSINWCINQEDSSGSTDSTLTLYSPTSLQSSVTDDLTNLDLHQSDIDGLEMRLEEFINNQTHSLVNNVSRYSKGLDLKVSTKYERPICFGEHKEVIKTDRKKSFIAFQSPLNTEPSHDQSKFDHLKIKNISSQFNLDLTKELSQTQDESDDDGNDNFNEHEVFQEKHVMSAPSLLSDIITNKKFNLSDTLLNRAKKILPQRSLPNLSELKEYEENKSALLIKQEFQARPTLVPNEVNIDFLQFTDNLRVSTVIKKTENNTEKLDEADEPNTENEKIVDETGTIPETTEIEDNIGISEQSTNQPPQITDELIAEETQKDEESGVDNTMPETVLTPEEAPTQNEPPIQVEPLAQEELTTQTQEGPLAQEELTTQTQEGPPAQEEPPKQEESPAQEEPPAEEEPPKQE